MCAKRKKNKVKVPINLLIASLGLIALVITALSTMGLESYFNLCTGAPASFLGRFGGDAKTVYLLLACFGVIFYGGLSGEFRIRLTGVTWLKKAVPVRNASVYLSALGFVLAIIRFSFLAAMPFVKTGSGHDIQTFLMVFSIIVWIYYILLLTAVAAAMIKK